MPVQAYIFNGWLIIKIWSIGDLFGVITPINYSKRVSKSREILFPVIFKICAVCTEC